MRSAGLATVIILLTSPPARAEAKKAGAEIDRRLYDVLKEVHNRGADLYNAGRAAECYRLYQGCLQTARAVLAHRPAEQKFIDDSQAQADRHPTVEKRAFALHEAVAKLRERLRAPAEASAGGPELIAVPPREFKQEKKEPPKKVVPPKDGVTGRLLWKGEPLAGAEVMFVSRGALDIKVIEGVTDAAGRYTLEKVPPGRYTVLLTQPGARKSVLPERYATATTSPLVVEVKGGGDTLDLLLQ